jgi:hypothetical protein
MKINSMKSSSLSEVLSQYSEKIFDQEVWVEKGLWKVAEVTYSYHAETNVNETLFIKLWWLNIADYIHESEEGKRKILVTVTEKVKEILQNKIWIIDQSLQDPKLQWDLSQADRLEFEIYKEAVLEKKDLLLYAFHALPFEWEKTGVIWNNSIQENERIESIVRWLDRKIYWWDIKDNPEEVELSYNYIQGIYRKNKKILTREEQVFFEECIWKSEKYLPIDYEPQEDLDETTPYVDSAILKKEITRKDYILGFNMSIDAFWDMGHIAKTDQNAWSISDGPYGVHFPAKKEFDSMTLERFLKLVWHEIETHTVTDQNTKWLIWNLRGAKSTEKDEWVAMLYESLFVYGAHLVEKDENWQSVIKPQNISINASFIRTLMWEILSSNDLKKFLEVSYKMDKDTMLPQARWMRLKRNNRDGVQHKDTTYMRGMFRAIKELNQYLKSWGTEGISPKDLFIWKISFDQTSTLGQLKTLKNKDTLSPLLISDAVYFMYTQRLQGNKVTWKEFFKYLKDKYPFLDFSEVEVTNVTQSVKKRVLGIVKIIENIWVSNWDTSVIDSIHSQLDISRQNQK